MRSAIVCYSLEGNSLHVAKSLASELDASLVRIVPVKAYPTSGVMKIAVGGKDAMFNKRPELEHYDFSPEDYDLVVVCFPVWADHVAAPMNTFLAANDLSACKVAACIQSAGGGAEKAHADLLAKLGGRSAQDVPLLSLKNPGDGKSEPELDAKIAAFAAQLR